MARKTNVTGIKGLSIGTTQNDRGYKMTRYTVNHVQDGKHKAKSFYFGSRQKQINAYKKACKYMLKFNLIDSKLDYLEIYTKLNHENLL